MATMPELESALRKAHAAGNADHARAIAGEIERQRAAARSGERNWAIPTRAVAEEPSAAKPSAFRMGSDFREQSGVGMLPMLGAAARDMFAGRESAAQYLAGKAGGTVGKDTDGEPTVVLPSGQPYRVNDAGLDMTDVANVVGNAAAFFTPAAWATRAGQAKNLGMLGRGGLQALAAGGTDAALQAGVTGGDIDFERTAAAAAGGAGGEVIGSLIGGASARAGDVGRRLTGQARQQAIGLLREAGVGQAPPSMLARLAGGVNEVQAGADARAILGRDALGFQYTLGQRMTDPVRKFDQLSREEVMRQSPGGGGVFRAAEDSNRQVLGDHLGRIGQRLGGRPGATPAELVQGAQSRLREQADALNTRVSEAYGKVASFPRTAIGMEEIGDLPSRLRAAVSDFGVAEKLHPAAYQTLADIADEVGKASDAGVTSFTLKAIENQRRIINSRIAAAANPADREATQAIKREFDGWLDDAVETALVTGDPAALAALKDARQLRFEYGKRFEGKTDADRFITGLLDGSKTPEELMNVALGASQVSKAGGARFIERLKAAAGGDPEVIGPLRAAHFQRLTMGRNGEPLDMGRIVSNIKATEYSNGSVVNALYSPAEWLEIKALTNALEPLVAKGDFARTSGTGERVARMLMSKLGGNMPVVGPMVQAVGDVKATMAARQALNQPLRLPARAHPAVPALGGATGQELVR